MWRDAIRSIRSARGVSVAVWVVMATSLAAATVVFTIVDHVAVRALPLPDAGRLFAIRSASVSEAGVFAPAAPQDYFLWRERLAGTAQVGASAGWSTLQLTTDAGPVPLVTQRATHSLFPALGITPVIGRGFEEHHESAGRDAVVLLTDRIWRRQFEADPSIVGRQVRFGSQTREVIGVLPAGFEYPISAAAPADVWIPYAFRPNDRDLSFGGRTYALTLVGRLAPGVSHEQVRQQVATVTESVLREFPNHWRTSRPSMTSLHDAVVGPVKQWMLVAGVAVGLVLLLASANVASLFTTRAVERQRDFAMRASLGASTGRLVRSALAESLLLSLSAGVAALSMAWVLLDRAVGLLPPGIARASSVALDMRILGIGFVAAAVVGVIAGVVPAIQAGRTDIMWLLRRSASPVRSRARAMLVTVQIAFAVVLVFGTAMFVASFVRVTSVDLGFDYRDRAWIPLGGYGPTSSPGASMEADDLLVRTLAVPGVRSAGFIDIGGLFMGGWVRYSVRVPGRHVDQSQQFDLHLVTPGYGDAAGLRLRDGRFISDADVLGAPAVAVVSQELANILFPGESAVGNRIEVRGSVRDVVGVVEGVRRQGPETPLVAAIYMPESQFPSDPMRNSTLLVRSSEPIRDVMPRVLDALAPALRAGQRAPVPHFLSDEYRHVTTTRRFLATVMSGFGVLALAIGAFGVYGVLTALVAQRSKEIGIRMALGAARRSVAGDVLRQTMRFVAAGAALGAGGAWLASSAVASQVFSTRPAEPAIILTVVVAVVLTAVLATVVPAWRATRVDPSTALRNDG